MTNERFIAPFASFFTLRGNARYRVFHISRIVEQLRAAKHVVEDEDLAGVSPLIHAHVTANGSYFQSPCRRTDAAPEPVMA